MRLNNQYTQGTFIWADLATTDAKKASIFYNRLFNWTAQTIQVGEGTFNMLHLRGQKVASLYQLNSQQQAWGIPPHWMAYVGVINADDTAVQAQQLGAQMLVAPFDLLDYGRMALLLDPTGAPFAIWQAGYHQGIGAVTKPGTMVWNELLTPAPRTAAAFYTRLFGWQLSPLGNDAWVFSRHGRLLASMTRPLTDTGSPLPHWQVYFAVQDCQVSVDTILASGGRIDTPPGNNRMGRRAIMQDPQGATFGLIALADLPKNVFANLVTDD